MKYFKDKIHFIVNQFVEDSEYPNSPSVNFRFITTADLSERYILLASESSESANFVGLIDENNTLQVQDISQIRFFEK